MNHKTPLQRNFPKQNPRQPPKQATLSPSVLATRAAHEQMLISPHGRTPLSFGPILGHGSGDNLHTCHTSTPASQPSGPHNPNNSYPPIPPNININVMIPFLLQLITQQLIPALNSLGLTQKINPLIETLNALQTNTNTLGDDSL